MKLIVTENFEASCETVARIMADLIKHNPQANLGLATGRTALKVYEPLIEISKEENISFKEVHTINLDEYVGMDPNNENSYRSQMNEALFNHVDIDLENTYTPVGTNNPQDEVRVLNEKLANHPLDFQLLGTGVNGHIGFNEPSSDALQDKVHIVKLDEQTIATNSVYFGNDTSLVPRESITMGVGDIMRAKKVVLIATGEEKAPALRQLLKGNDISTQWPVSLLKLHQDVTVIIDKDLEAAL